MASKSRKARSKKSVEIPLPFESERHHRSRNRSVSLVLLFLTIAILLTGAFASLGVPILLGYLVAISLITFIAFGWDKWQASRSRRRIPEVSLHALAFFGGTPGSFFGQRFFRHKTIKASFRTRFWWIVAAQTAALVVWALVRGGAF